MRTRSSPSLPDFRRSRAWRELREQLFAAAGGRCACCGRVAPQFELDHIVPRSKGGTDDPSNLQILRTDCHRAKSAAEESRRRRGRPRPPRTPGRLEAMAFTRELMEAT